MVIDKQELRRAYGTAAAHPYHLGLGFLLQRFAGYLNHINRVGDILGESRGGREDRLLKESYSRVFERGVWMTRSDTFHPVRSDFRRVEAEAQKRQHRGAATRGSARAPREAMDAEPFRLYE